MADAVHHHEDDDKEPEELDRVRHGSPSTPDFRAPRAVRHWAESGPRQMLRAWTAR